MAEEVWDDNVLQPPGSARREGEKLTQELLSSVSLVAQAAASTAPGLFEGQRLKTAKVSIELIGAAWIGTNHTIHARSRTSRFSCFVVFFFSSLV
jgi:hypothetical protein